MALAKLVANMQVTMALLALASTAKTARKKYNYFYIKSTKASNGIVGVPLWLGN
jgi:hypothetical protein